MSDAGARRLTPKGSGGVAVLRVSGPDAVAILRRRFSRELPASGGITVGTLAAGSAECGPESGPKPKHVPEYVLDEVLVVACPGGGGEEGYEVHAHGSPFVVGELLRVLLGGNAPDGDDEDLPFEERARRGVSHAPTAVGARILLDQAGGAMARALDSVAQLPPAERRTALAHLAAAGRERERLFRETTVVLRGPVNAGKSTLFNVLSGADAAAVSSVEGTTRDALVETTRIGPWPVRLMDTAGERDLGERVRAGDRRAEVEALGQRLAAELSRRADLVLELRRTDATEIPAARAADAAAVVHTQAALVLEGEPESWPDGTLSAREAPRHARDVVLGIFSRALGLTSDIEGLWKPGRAVPFDERSILNLEVAAAEDVTDTVLDDLRRNL